MPATTDRPPDQQPLWRRLLWMALIWGASVATVAAIAFLLRAVMIGT